MKTLLRLLFFLSPVSGLLTPVVAQPIPVLTEATAAQVTAGTSGTTFISPRRLAGFGTVAGPASATDNAIPRFDGTTGKLLQNSVLLVADTTGALSGFTTGVGATFHGGGTLTGASGGLTLATASTGALAVTSADTGTVISANFLAGSAANGSTVNWRYGVAVAAGNGGSVAFGYTSTNHASNYFALGIIGQTHITMFNSGNIVLGSGPVDGTGKLQFPTGTTSAHGIMLGNVPIFQSASSVGNLGGGQWVFPNGAAISAPGLRPDGGSGSGLFFSGSTFYVTSGAALVFATNTGTTALTLDSSQNATFAGVIIESTDTRSGAGAVSVTKTTTKVTSTGVLDALTLANGVDGQVKRIVHDVDGGSFVLTPTTKTGWSTYTSTVVGESISLQYVTTRGWIVIGSYLGTIAP